MRIMYLSSSSLPSGKANSIQVMKMCQALSRNGHQVTLIGRTHKARKEVNIKDIFTFYGVKKVFRINLIRSFKFRLFASLFYGIGGIIIAKKLNPDIAYVRDLTGGLLLALFGYKVIFEVHIPQPITSWIRGKLLVRSKNLVRIVVISNNLKTAIIKKCPNLENRIEIVVAHDGADIIKKEWPRVPCGGSLKDCNRNEKIGYVGQLYPGKGAERIVELGERMRDVVFNIFGGFDLDIARLQRTAGKNIVFHGFVNPSKINSVLNSLDILLLPAAHRVYPYGGKAEHDNISPFMSPLKMFEYMASGKAIIASDLPVLKEVLVHNHNALLCKYEEIEEWVHAIKLLSGDIQLRRRLGENAKNDFEKEFTWAIRAQKVVNGIPEERLHQRPIIITRPKKKILFLAPSMRGGGTERFVSVLLNHIDIQKFDLILGLIRKDGVFLESLPNFLKIVDFGSDKVRYSPFKIAKLIREEKPDIVFSTLGHLNLVVMCIRPLISRDVKFVARETNIPSINLRYSPFPRLFPIMYRTLYPRYDRGIFQSDDMLNDVVQQFRFPVAKASVINNPVDFEAIERLVYEECEDGGLPRGKYNVIGAGKLKYQKGFDLAIRAMCLLKDQNIHLTILGQGSEMDRLKQLTQDFGVSGKVSFRGFKKNPFPYFLKADLFMLSSRFEGFPNVVLEAMACGTPVLAFDCPGGINEIIEDGVNGMRVEASNIRALAEGVEAMHNRTYDSDLIRNEVKRKFGVKAIVPIYEKMFSELCD